MNCSVYIFGQLSSGYIQYPEDSSIHVLSGVYSHCKAATQIVIHRNENLMYYCYIRKLTDKQYIGFTIVINGYYVKSVNSLFTIFEGAIENLATHGFFIKYSTDGNIISCDTISKSDEEEIYIITKKISEDFEVNNNLVQLPHTNYSVAKDSKKIFFINDAEEDIVSSSYTYGYTFIYKDKDYNTIRLNSYHATLSRLNNENIVLKKNNHDLQIANKDILRQKKQFRNVILLMFVIIACGIGMYFLYEDLGSTQVELENANLSLSDKNEQISQKEIIISRQSDTIAYLKNSYNDVVIESEALKDELKIIYESQSFLFMRSSFNFSTGYLTIGYRGLKAGLYTIKIRVIPPDGGTIHHYVREVSIYRGVNEFNVYINSGLNVSKYYIFEVMYNDRVIGGGRH